MEREQETAAPSCGFETIRLAESWLELWLELWLGLLLELWIILNIL